MWYNDYHNVLFSNSTYEQPSDNEQNETLALLMEMNETIHSEVGSYDPSLDFFGPHKFIPFHCYSADTTKKYESPVIGYIDNGNEITADVIEQLSGVFRDLSYIKELVFDLDDFLNQFGSFLDPLQLLIPPPSQVDADEATTEEERKELEEEARREEEALKEQLDLQPFNFN